MPIRKIALGAIVLASSLLFGGCLVAKPADITTESPDVTVTGVVTQAGTKFSLTTSDRKIIDLDSRQVDLAPYAGKSVTLTGQYSGTTLYVSEVR